MRTILRRVVIGLDGSAKDAQTGQLFCLNRQPEVLQPLVAKCWNQQPRPPAGIIFCFKQPLLLLEPSSIFAGTNDFHGSSMETFFFCWDWRANFMRPARILASTSHLLCWNHHTFLLEPTFFRRCVYLFVGIKRTFLYGQRECFNQHLFLLELAVLRTTLATPVNLVACIIPTSIRIWSTFLARSDPVYSGRPVKFLQWLENVPPVRYISESAATIRVETLFPAAVIPIPPPFDFNLPPRPSILHDVGRDVELRPAQWRRPRAEALHQCRCGKEALRPAIHQLWP